MSVNLTKPEEMRSYTPVHLIDEEEAMPRKMPTQPSYTPEHIAYEPEAPVAKKSANELAHVSIAVQSDTAQIAVAPNNAPHTYSEYVKHDEQRYLDTVFRTPTADEVNNLNEMVQTALVTMRKSFRSFIPMMLFGGVSLLGIISMIVFGQLDMLEFVLGSGITASISALLFLTLGAFLADSSTMDILSTLKTASAVYICDTGANTKTTADKMWFNKRHISWDILRPKHCTDYGAYVAITTDEHPVYAVYSSETGKVVFVDPMLFA